MKTMMDHVKFWAMVAGVVLLSPVLVPLYLCRVLSPMLVLWTRLQKENG